MVANLQQIPLGSGLGYFFLAPKGQVAPIFRLKANPQKPIANPYFCALVSGQAVEASESLARNCFLQSNVSEITYPFGRRLLAVDFVGKTVT
jgi:hypothetical protein